MTNRAMMGMLRMHAAARLGRVVAQHESKLELLRAVAQQDGPGSAVALGATLRDAPPHPVFDAVTAPDDPIAVLERWMRLERFGHTRNRTRLVDSSVTPGSVGLEHVAQDGGTIDPLADLFVWGMLAGVLERSGCRGVSAELTTDTGDSVVVYADGGAAGLAATVTESNATARILMRWSPTAERPVVPHAVADSPDTDDTVVTALHRLVASDLVHPWRVDEAARALAMSSRQLQRTLRAQETTFSEAVQRARIEAARRLMLDRRVSLSEVAFCSGFSDAAHFSRLFRRHLDVPPSAYRDLALADAE